MRQKFICPKVIIYRFIDVLVTSGRLKFDYVNITSDNLASFLAEFWEQNELIELVNELRELSRRDNERTTGVSPCVFKTTQAPSMIQVDR